MKNQLILNTVQNRKTFIENDLCTLMTNIYGDISSLKYSKSRRKRERVTIVCEPNTYQFHKKKYNIIEITNKDIYETIIAIAAKIKQIHITNLMKGIEI